MLHRPGSLCLLPVVCAASCRGGASGSGASPGRVYVTSEGSADMTVIDQQVPQLFAMALPISVAR